MVRPSVVIVAEVDVGVVFAVTHLDHVQRAADPGFVLDVAQLDDVVEQEHEPIEGLLRRAQRGGLAGDQQGSAGGADRVR